jgi:hypothetical protein
MNVAEFREWLLTQDQEAIVEVLVHSSGTGYYDQGGNVSVEEFTPEEKYGCGKYFEYIDFRGNQFVKTEASYYNRRVLQLGTTDN